MSNLLRLLGFYLCVPIYTIIPKIYEIFYYLASARFFTGDSENVIKNLSSNLYTLVSIVMLFVFSASMLASIVNPDLIEDKKKGVAAVFKRAIIGIVLVVAIPFVFDKAYELQTKIIDSHLIEKTLVGMQFSDDSNEFTGGNGGKVIAGSLISSVIYPSSDNIQISDSSSGRANMVYGNMVSNIDTMSSFSDYLNAVPNSGDVEYAFEFNGIIALIAGLVADYILILFAMDMAVRVFKLAFFELTAPVSIIAYIAAGDDTFKKWAMQVGTTFLDVFIRIAAMAFYLFLISNLDGFINSKTLDGNGVSWEFLLKLLLIIGMLIFVKQIPDLIKKVFGFDISTRGGIKGRLGEMAAVGKQAQKAWQALPKVAALGGAAAVAGTGKAIGFTGKKIDKLTGGKISSLASNVKGFATKDKFHPFQNSSNGALRKIGGGIDNIIKNGPSNVVQGAKEVGRAIKGAAGASSVLGAAKAGYEATNVGKRNNYIKEQKEQDKFNEKFGDILDADGNVVASGKEAVAKIKALIEGDTSIPNNLKTALTAYIDEKSQVSSHNQIKSNIDKINGTFDTLMANTQNESIRNTLANMKHTFNSGDYTEREFANKVNDLVKSGSISTADGANLRNNFGNIVETMKNSSVGSSYSYSDDGKILVNKNKDQVKIAEKRENAAKLNYESIYNNMSDDSKKSIDRYIAKTDEIVEKKVKDEKSYKIKDHDDNNVYYDANGNLNNYASSSTGMQQNSQNSNINGNIQGGTINVDNLNVGNLNANNVNGDFVGFNNVPNGFSQTSSGIAVPNNTNNRNSGNDEEIEELTDEVITENERLRNEIEKIEARIKKIESKGAFMTEDDKEEIKELRQDLYKRATEESQNNGGPNEE